MATQNGTPHCHCELFALNIQNSSITALRDTGHYVGYNKDQEPKICTKYLTTRACARKWDTMPAGAFLFSNSGFTLMHHSNNVKLATIHGAALCKPL